MRADCAEEPFENALLKLAVTHGWLVHASRKAHRKSPDNDNVYRTPIKGHRGFPDIVLSHPDHGLIIAELKSAKGRYGPGQKEWVDSLVPLDRPGSEVLIELWRPADWPWIEIALRDGLDAYRHRVRQPR